MLGQVVGKPLAWHYYVPWPHQSKMPHHHHRGHHTVPPCTRTYPLGLTAVGMAYLGSSVGSPWSRCCPRPAQSGPGSTGEPPHCTTMPPWSATRPLRLTLALAWCLNRIAASRGERWCSRYRWPAHWWREIAGQISLLCPPLSLSHWQVDPLTSGPSSSVSLSLYVSFQENAVFLIFFQNSYLHF